MFSYLKQVQNTDILSSKNTLTYAGRSGGRKLAIDLLENLEEEGEISTGKLQKMILGES